MIHLQNQFSLPEGSWLMKSVNNTCIWVYGRTAYKNLAFCEMFHSEETGWRECTSCGKVNLLIAYSCKLLWHSSQSVLIDLGLFGHLQRLHCGCIASSPLLELLDTGGVVCKGCSKSSKRLSVRTICVWWNCELPCTIWCTFVFHGCACSCGRGYGSLCSTYIYLDQFLGTWINCQWQIKIKQIQLYSTEKEFGHFAAICL